MNSEGGEKDRVAKGMVGKRLVWWMGRVVNREGDQWEGGEWEGSKWEGGESGHTFWKDWVRKYHTIVFKQKIGER